MTIRPLLASLCASLDDFLAKPLDIVDVSGASAVAILDANQPVFYVVSPDFWKKIAHPERLISTKPPKTVELDEDEAAEHDVPRRSAPPARPSRSDESGQTRC